MWTMTDNMRLLCAIGLVVFFFSCASGQGGTPKPPDRGVRGPVWIQLTSPSESERFRALESVNQTNTVFEAGEIEQALTGIRPKNTSTLIFLFMERRNDLLYRLSVPAKMALENSEGSFPNIAYYYARVRPSEGIGELFRLYNKRADQKMAVCKAIGETSLDEGTAFLWNEISRSREPGSRIPMLAGLNAASGRRAGKSRITQLLNSDLDREEIILLSQLKTDFGQDELVALFNGGGRQHAYAMEYIFSSPERNFEALQAVITQMMERNQLDAVRALLMSDRIRGSTDERVQKFRQSILAKTNRGLQLR